jgi:hypothetical protein
MMVSNFAISDGAYKATWSRDWAAINADARAFAPSPASPGACNTGGTKIGCYDTSLKVAGDLQTLADDLSTTNVPSQFQTANATLNEAVDLDVTGLKLRAQSLTVAESTLPGDNAAFTAGYSDIHQANPKFGVAYSEFPSFDRPLPLPFAGGYSG